jgi:hypothetical protein
LFVTAPHEVFCCSFNQAIVANLSLAFVPPPDDSQHRFVHPISLAFRKLDESLRYWAGFCFSVRYGFLFLPEVSPSSFET